MLKTAVVAPMASESVPITIAVKPGVRISFRAEYRTSRTRVSKGGGGTGDGGQGTGNGRQGAVVGGSGTSVPWTVALKSCSDNGLLMRAAPASVREWDERSESGQPAAARSPFVRR